MSAEIDPNPDNHLAAVEAVTAGIAASHARAVILFGSLARRLAGEGGRPPRDADLLVVTNNPLFAVPPPGGLPCEIHRFRTEQIESVARCLRYDSRPAALARLYAKNLAKSHARDIIAACLLLGPAYREFGIEQIDIDGRSDPRDYSIHRVMHGHDWWRDLGAYARQRRGPLARWGDRVAGCHRFENWRRSYGGGRD